MSEGDNDNKIYISPDKILVVYKQKRKTFLLKDISKLKPETKKMLFPLIVGGILTPLSSLSFFVNLSLPWLHLIAILGGMLLFYLGWTGKTVLTLVFRNGDELNYYLPSVSKNLEAFMEFANVTMHQYATGSFGNLLYFDLQNEELDIFFGKQTESGQSLFPVYGYTYAQVANAKKGKNELTAIDASKAGIEIKFTYHRGTGLMRPVVDQPLLQESHVMPTKSDYN